MPGIITHGFFAEISSSPGRAEGATDFIELHDAPTTAYLPHSYPVDLSRVVPLYRFASRNSNSSTLASIGHAENAKITIAHCAQCGTRRCHT